MSTLVKFYKENNGEVLAVFPQLNYNKSMYGNSMKTGYVHIGQHTAVAKDYYKDLEPANFGEYADLYHELTGLGYDLHILNLTYA